jgi:hypothetical protein
VQNVRDSEHRDPKTHGSVVTVATLLALNSLESVIRQLTSPQALQNGNNSSNSAPGGPLLKTMIPKLYLQPAVPYSLAKICELLLLPPHQGLNFRNLVWHGFVAPVPRPWFALVVVVTRELIAALPNDADDATGASDGTRVGNNLRDHPEFETLLNERSGRWNDQENALRIVSWVRHTTESAGHAALCEKALEWMTTRNHHDRPATICAILSVVLEHCLRLMWCRANNRAEDRQARPGAFYVTLDGHGQRHVHDLILHPYVLGKDGCDNIKNQLIWSEDDDRPLFTALDQSSVALLTDLYCSPFGPNIRASVAHGMWNDKLLTEWQQSAFSNPMPQIWDMASAIFHVMDHLSLLETDGGASLTSTPPLRHRAVFSYAQETRRHANRAKEALEQLGALSNKSTFMSAQNLEMSTPCFQGEEAVLTTFGKFLPRDSAKISLPLRMTSNSMETNLHAELEVNQQLASLGASRSLLESVADACQSHLARLMDGHAIVVEDDKPTCTSAKRKRKKALRLLYANNALITFYNFAFWVALETLDSGNSPSPPTIPFEVVKRTCMVVSTVETFVDSNLDRAVKSIVELTKSKALNEMLLGMDHTKKIL